MAKRKTKNRKLHATKTRKKDTKKQVKQIEQRKQTKQTKKAEEQKLAYDQAVMAWYAPQFLRFKRGYIWYIIALLLDIALIAYAVWSEAWSMALVFAVLPFVFALEHRSKPKTVQVIISPYGIKFGKLRIPFSDIKRFWIFHDPPYVDELHILTNDKLHPEITIPLMGADPTLLRHYLVTQIPEWEGKKESFLDTLIRLFRLS